MRHLLYILFAIVAISCEDSSDQKIEEPKTIELQISKPIYNGQLSILFSNGELENDTIPIEKKNAFIKQVDDSLLAEFHTGFGFVGSTINLRIYNDKVKMKSIKWSCTYSDSYLVQDAQISIDEQNYSVLDSLSLSMNCVLTYSDTSRNYIDTLRIFGSIRLQLRDSSYNSDKRNQEFRLADFLQGSESGIDTIQELNLDRLGINYIPKKVLMYKNLVTLDLGGNKIPDNDLPMLLELKNLRELDLRWNEYESVPSNLLKFKKLRFLSLSGNQLSSLPTDFVELSELQELRLYGNKFTEIPIVLSKMPNLEILEIDDNPIENIDVERPKFKNIEKIIE